MESHHWIDFEAHYEYCEKLDPEAREQCLKKLTKTQPAMGLALSKLFTNHTTIDNYFAHAPGKVNRPDWQLTQAPKNSDFPQIRNYQVIEHLDSGGMGQVYLAEQQEPVARQVAMKIIQPHCSSQEYWARFLAERDTLARMSHPVIAHLFDSGFAEDGRPFFSMEFIQGLAITDYCETHKLTVRERITLFLDVCQGILHAHQKMVIHRDLKPANILVTHQNGKPIVKIIDFGISKQMDAHPEKPDSITQDGGYLGTIPYLSPEQACGTGHQTDTRTDIYALGIVLFEMLTGAWPFDRDLINQSFLDQKLRIVREVEPLAPSKILETNHKWWQTLSGSTGKKSKALLKSFKRDLDWILLQTLAKDPDKRYASVNGLIEDLKAFLNRRPIQARPPSAVYRLRKFYERNRIISLSSMIVFFALIFGIINTTLAKKRVMTMLRKHDAAFYYLDQTLQSPAPNNMGPDLTVLSLAHAGSARLDQDLPNQPIVRSFVETVYGNLFSSLGLYPEAEKLFQDSYDTRLKHLGSNDSYTWEAIERLASANLSQNKIGSALNLYQQVETLQIKAKTTNTHLYAKTLFGLGVLIAKQQSFDVTHYFERTIAIVQTLPRPDEELIWKSKIQLGLIEKKEHRYAKALALLSEAFHWFLDTHGPSHSETLRCLAMIGHTYIMANDTQKGLDLLEKATILLDHHLGSSHLMSIRTRQTLVKAYKLTDSLEKAEMIALAAAESIKNIYHTENLLSISSENLLATILKKRHCRPMAIELLRSLPIFNRELVEQKTQAVREVLNNLGDYLNNAGELIEARWYLDEALAQKLDNNGPNQRSTIITFATLAENHLAMGDFDSATILAESAYDLAKINLSQRDGIRSFCQGLLGLSQWGKDPKAASGYQHYQIAMTRLKGHPGYQRALQAWRDNLVRIHHIIWSPFPTRAND